jgi:hypothetical protein
MLSRRKFLSLTASAALVAASRLDTQARRLFAQSAAPRRSKARLIVAYELDQKPALGGAVGALLPADSVIPVYEQLTGAPVGEHNNTTWFRTDGGYVHSAWVQLVDDAPQPLQPVDIAQAGFWAQVSVPFVDARVSPDGQPRGRLYFSSVYRVSGVVADKSGLPYYRIADALRGGGFAPAHGLRRLEDVELAPITPEIDDKLIDINLRNHMVTLIERGQPVFEARCASGRDAPTTFTPTGGFRVLRKLHGVHMRGGQAGIDAYDLPGVPFATFFTARGVALHGAYWHFDWGARRTHGCINLDSDDAKYVWRWATVARGRATRVRVRAG